MLRKLSSRLALSKVKPHAVQDMIECSTLLSKSARLVY